MPLSLLPHPAIWNLGMMAESILDCEDEHSSGGAGRERRGRLEAVGGPNTVQPPHQPQRAYSGLAARQRNTSSASTEMGRRSTPPSPSHPRTTLLAVLLKYAQCLNTSEHPHCWSHPHPLHRRLQKWASCHPPEASAVHSQRCSQSD